MLDPQKSMCRSKCSGSQSKFEITKLTLSTRILQESAKVDETSTSGWVWVGWWYDGVCFFRWLLWFSHWKRGSLSLLVLLIGGWCMEAGLWYQALSDISAPWPTSPCRAWPQLLFPKRPNLKLLFRWFSCWLQEKPKQQLGIYIYIGYFEAFVRVLMLC